MRTMISACALILLSVSASGAGAKPAPAGRILVATSPPAEMRLNGELMCVTPCVVDAKILKGMMTLSNDGLEDVGYRVPMSPSPPGGAWDPAQSVILEIGRDFIMITRTPDMGANDNVPPPPPSAPMEPPQPIRPPPPTPNF